MNSCLYRFLRVLKCYVHNKSQPEGSIAEGYIVEESLMFCSRYLHNVDSKFSRCKRNSEGNQDEPYNGLSVFAPSGYPLSKDKAAYLSDKERKQAHLFVLKKCEEVQPFLQYEFLFLYILLIAYSFI